MPPIPKTYPHVHLRRFFQWLVSDARKARTTGRNYVFSVSSLLYRAGLEEIDDEVQSLQAIADMLPEVTALEDTLWFDVPAGSVPGVLSAWKSFRQFFRALSGIEIAELRSESRQEAFRRYGLDRSAGEE